MSAPKLFRMVVTFGPKLPKMPNELLGSHWMTRSSHKKTVKRQVLAAIQGLPWPKQPLRMARVHLTRRSSVQPDHDGLVGSFKPVIDSLVELGVLANDSAAEIGQPTYVWEKASPGKGSVIVVIEEIRE